MPRYCSIAALTIPYEPIGRSGWLSGIGIVSGTPYTVPPEDRNNSLAIPSSIIDRTKVSVLTKLSWTSPCGLKLAVPGNVVLIMWKTCRPRERFDEERPVGKFAENVIDADAGRPETFRPPVKHTHAWPRARSASTTCEPINRSRRGRELS